MYNMDLQTHTCKQVQMHMTDKITAEKLAAKAKNSNVFTRHFSYNTCYFAKLDNEPITVERFVDGEFTKYVNNDGNPCQTVLGESCLFEQTEALVHIFMKQEMKSFYWLICKGRIIIYTIQRSQLQKHN